jgi:hypothetical protein
VSQTVRLNTPGKQDGGFELVVNGQRIIRRDDVFYRDLPSKSDRNDGSDGGNSGNNEDGWSGGGRDGDGHGDSYGGDIGGDEGGLLGDLLRRGSVEMAYSSSPILLSPYPPVASSPDDGRTSQAPLFVPQAVPIFPEETVPMGSPITDHIPVSTGIQTVTVTATVTTTRSAQGEVTTPQAGSSQNQMESQADASSAIGFSGIFFRCVMCARCVKCYS